MRQKILNFRFSENTDFFVSPKNTIAFNLIQSWPNWNSQISYIYGPSKCGKTLIKLFMEKNLMQYFSMKKNLKILLKMK